jgi:hypothetical protein
VKGVLLHAIQANKEFGVSILSHVVFAEQLAKDREEARAKAHAAVEASLAAKLAADVTDDDDNSAVSNADVSADGKNSCAAAVAVAVQAECEADEPLDGLEALFQQPNVTAAAVSSSSKSADSSLPGVCSSSRYYQPAVAHLQGTSVYITVAQRSPTAHAICIM